MTNQVSTSGPFHKIWDFFSSVKLTIVLLLSLAATSIVGTLIPQNEDPAAYFKAFGGYLFRLFNILDLFDMYHSWWFITLLSLFCLNLLVCSIERLPRIWKLVTDPMIPLKENVLRNLGIRHELKIKSSPAEVRSVLQDVLKGAGFSVGSVEEEGGGQVFGQKGAYSRLGVYVVHGSILVIFVGAIVGLLLGYKGGLNLPEGGTSDVIYRYGSGEQVKLGFSVRCNWYETEFYGSSDQPKLFRSELTVIENGQEIMKKWIRVNDPLVYRGVTFYQSSYGMIPEPTGGRFVFRFRTPGSEAQTLWLSRNIPTTLPGTDIQATVVDFSPALTTNRKTGQLYTYTNTMNNPAVKVRFTRGGQDAFQTGWIWKRWPETGKLPDGLLFEFQHFWGAQYTGLQVRKDPGVWLVYAGCTFMSIALFVAFFVSHRKIWVRIEGAGSGSNILVGASAHRNKVSFEKDVEKIVARLSARLEGET